MTDRMERPRTGVCVGGPRDGHLRTVGSWLNTVLDATLLGELSLYTVTTMDVHLPGAVLSVNVLLEAAGLPHEEAFEHLVQATVLVMAMRGWPGPDEGERWVIRLVPVEEGDQR